MKVSNPRIYGKSAYRIAVINGGPGASGYMAPVARELSKTRGVLEPLQTKDSIDGLKEELYKILHEHAEFPVILIGHSWGGFLSMILAVQYPELIKKLIFVSTGPFEDKYVSSIKDTRNQRLREVDKNMIKKLEDELILNHQENLQTLKKLGNLTSKADSYDPIPSKSEVIEYDHLIFSKVWGETIEMRSHGGFMDIIKKISHSVIAIHGDYDPHPYQAVKEPFSKYVREFRFFLLEKCGHYPWLEKLAKDRFYEILDEVLN